VRYGLLEVLALAVIYMLAVKLLHKN